MFCSIKALPVLSRSRHRPDRNPAMQRSPASLRCVRGVAAGAASRWEPRAQRSRTPSGLIAKHDFGNSEAPLMARQQFVTHLPRIHLSRSLVSVRECANSLITNEPCYLRDRKVGVTQVMRGEI